MKTKVIHLIIAGLFCNVYSYGQSKVLLENGSFINMSSIEIDDKSVTLIVDNETQTISKEELLCVFPEGTKPYAFRQKNDTKSKLKKKIISNNFQGVDIAKLFAYKYYNNERGYQIIGELYKKNSESPFSEEEFERVFREQHRQITKSKVTGYIVGGLAISIALNSLAYY